MEKILPHPILPRFFDSPKDELKIVDRMVIRDDPPKWRGDHSFSPDAAKYSFSNFIEPEVTKKNPDWTREQVREQALEKFEKRLRQDLSYEKKELAHEESSVSWQQVQTENGWELATAYGDTMITLSELWEHTKEFAAFSGNPAAYNAEEHCVQLRMQDAFIRGEATGFVSVLSHPDSVRYVQIWNKADDGSIVSTHVDLAKTTGRDFTHEEGATLIRNLQSIHGGDEAPQSTYAHFFVREQNVSEYNIRAVAVVQTIEVNHSPVPRESGSVGGTVLRDTLDSMVVLGAYLRDHIERRISDFKEHAQKKQKPLSEHSFSVMETSNGIKPKRTRAEKEEPIKSVLADWWVTKGILRHVDRVPVAAVAALLWITQDVNVRAVDPEGVKRFSTIRHAEKQEKMTDIKISGIKIFSERVGELIVKSTKKLVSLMALEKTQVSTAARIKRTESNLPRVVSARDVLSRFDARVMLVHWINAIQKTIVWARVLNIFREKSRHFIEITKHRRRELAGRKKPSEVARFREEVKFIEHFSPIEVALVRFAFLVWWAIRVHHGTEVSSSAKIESVPRHKDVSAPRSRRRRLETGMETNSPQWILLSIIWHLALLREVGFSKKKKKKKKGRSLLWHHISLHFVIE